MKKDKKATERRLLDSLGQIIEENGLKQMGVNEVARGRVCRRCLSTVFSGR